MHASAELQYNLRTILGGVAEGWVSGGVIVDKRSI